MFSYVQQPRNVLSAAKALDHLCLECFLGCDHKIVCDNIVYRVCTALQTVTNSNSGANKAPGGTNIYSILSHFPHFEDCLAFLWKNTLFSKC